MARRAARWFSELLSTVSFFQSSARIPQQPSWASLNAVILIPPRGKNGLPLLPPQALSPQDRQAYTDELLRLQLKRARAELDVLAPTGLKMKLKIIGDYLKPSAIAISALAGIALGAIGFIYGTKEAEDKQRDLKYTNEQLSALTKSQNDDIDKQKTLLLPPSPN